ncbi:MAG: YhdP family protein, partial [Panacagrimonas sp.]
WLQARLADDARVGFRETELNLEGVLKAGSIGVIDLRLDAGAVVGRRGQDEAILRDIDLAARLTPEVSGWVLDVTRLELGGVQGPWPAAQARLRYVRAQDSSPADFEAQASYLNLSDLAPWMALLPNHHARQPAARLQRATGALRGLVLRWNPTEQGPRYSLRADLDQIGLSSSRDLPGFEGLSGELSATESGGRLALRDAPFALSYPKVFAQSLGFESISGELSWSRTDKGWDVRTPRFGWQLDGSQGEGEFALLLPDAAERSPTLKLDARFSAADVTRFKPYMPVFWNQNLRNWLDRAVVAGRSPTGRLHIDGDLLDFPFVDKPGSFELDIDASNATLAFAPDWPRVEKAAAHLEFRGSRLAIRGDAGRLSGTRVEKMQALIEDFRDPRLRITGEAQGDAARFYEFLAASPLAPRVAALLNRTTASGDAVVEVALDIPLNSVRDTQVQGTAHLRGVQLNIKGVPEPIVDARGDLWFDNRSLSAQDLQAQMYASPVSASIRTDDAGVQHLLGQFEFIPDPAGTGVSALLPGFLRTHLQGRTRGEARLALSGPDSGRLRLSSNLQGLSSSLPPPMDKNAEALWPLDLEFGSDPAFPLRIAVEMPERMGLEMAFTRDAGNALLLQRARVRAGAGMPPHADDDGVFISGTVADLDPLRWLEAVRSPAGTAPATDAAVGTPLALHADLNVGHLWMGGQMVEGVRLTHAPAAAGWAARVSGNGAQGELVFRNTDDGGVLTGRFPRLQLAARRRVSETEPVKPQDDQKPPLHPGQLPRLDLIVEDLRAGAAELGRLDLRTARIAEGQRLEVLQTTGSGGKISARGEWRRRAERSSADLQLSIESDAVDQLLSAMGYAPNLSAKRSRFDAALRWPEQADSATRGIRWALGRGELKLDLDKGTLRAVEPGAGRVLGLINFWALPRRLSLDFGDVLSDGLGFDQISGQFAMADGVASTDNLDIKAPSLRMEVRGNVGLAARDYDQRVTVYPDVSAGVTLGALLIGGPAAGVLALIAQEVLEQPLDQVGQLSYHLTGSWDDPQVVRGETPAPDRAPSPTPSPAAGPRGGS